MLTCVIFSLFSKNELCGKMSLKRFCLVLSEKSSTVVVGVTLIGSVLGSESKKSDYDHSL